MIRRGGDGAFILIRSNPALEREYDKLYQRVPGEKKWYPRPKLMCEADFKNKHLNVPAIFIGKGPSLDVLSTEDLPPFTCIFAINNAIHKVETFELNSQIYCVQQDSSLKGVCIPKRALHFLSWNARGWNPDATIYKPEQFKLKASALTVLVAIELAKLMGCNTFTFLCFDACLYEDTRYAQCIGGTPHSAQQFLKHREIILKTCPQAQFVPVKNHKQNQ